MTDTEMQVQHVLDAYVSAVRAKNAEMFLGLYDADVRVFDTWGTWAYEGAAAWRTAVEGWFSSLGDENVRVTFADVQIVGEAGLTSMSAIVTYAGLSPQGEELRAMQNRISWVLKTRADGAGIVHEHTSFPIGFDDLTAILQRDIT